MSFYRIPTPIPARMPVELGKGGYIQRLEIFQICCKTLTLSEKVVKRRLGKKAIEKCGNSRHFKPTAIVKVFTKR